MSYGQKRKRAADDDDDEPSYGLRQILPIANLPADFDGEPMDGMQYLFTVRRDARKLPGTTRVANPYEVIPSSAPGVPSTSDGHPKPDVGLPSEEWRAAFERRFRNFRSNILQPTTSPLPPPQRKLYPDKKDRDAWWAFLSGAPESVWNPPRTAKQGKQRRQQRGFQFGRGGAIELDSADRGLAAAGWEMVPPTKSAFSSGVREEFVSDDNPQTPRADAGFSSGQLEPAASSDRPWEPREPTPSIMRFIDHRTSVHILMYFAHWFGVHLDALRTTGDVPASSEKHTPLDSHFRWIFAFLSRVDTFCTADEISGLRALVRVCLALIGASRARARAVLEDRMAESDIASTPGADDGENDPNPTEECETGGDMKAGPVDSPSSVQIQDKPREVMESSTWIILCAVAGHWGQRDLWYDADELLKKGA